MKPIEEQAAERGVPVPVGATAGELRAHGWDVPPYVLDTAVLDEPVEGEPVVVHGIVPRPTRYCWRGWRRGQAS